VHRQRPAAVAGHRPPIEPPRYRPVRSAVWSAPDGGRWGRLSGRLAPGTGHRVTTVHLPLAVFGRQPVWIGIVRPL
jgi:hypothetical protein